ncbi:hypothetical protein [Heyndrickxia ginsengihumi]|uniref:hypothetical protein n=1 Tax=Heyndrickxia ginsengihumi TaxID=363870 RepID=UPI0012DF514C|nr:hypothetical protein [Heyndrickxia ginsengihumi]
MKANYYTDKIDNVVNKTEIVYKPVQQKDLVALNTVTQTEEKGKNILFISSYHSSDDYYFRYAVKTKFGYQIKKMKVEDKKVYIKETNTNKPRFVKLQQQYKNKGVQLYEQRYDLSYEGKVKYQFIVPKGTVENSYDVKLR